MAYYVRTYKSGAGDYDPRQIIWAQYLCFDCNKKTDIRIPDIKTFRFADVPCSHCGSVKAGDRYAALSAERNRLQNEVATRLTRMAEIDALLAEGSKVEVPAHA